MGIAALYPKTNLSRRLHAEYVRPYLLKGLTIDHVDQAWGVDITYLPLRKGFLYLFVVIDWYSRCIVDYNVSVGLDKSFVMRCLFGCCLAGVLEGGGRGGLLMFMKRLAFSILAVLLLAAAQYMASDTPDKKLPKRQEGKP